ncbi:MAG: AAA family ATPase [Candidatus Odinarchaeota archaeon]|nr:AAA family ATPase [Candidatus Odinarchaeota archaeon]
MVSSLYIMGFGYSGKTAICLGLGQKFMKQKKKVGYMKPVTLTTKLVDGEPTDDDIKLMKKVFGLSESMDQLSPVRVTYRYITELEKTDPLKKITKAFKTVSKDKDIVILESTVYPEILLSYNSSACQIAKELNAKILFVVQGDKDSVVDHLLLYKELAKNIGVELIGVIINNVPHHLFERFRGIIVPFLEEHGIQVFGVIPEKIELIAPTVRDILTHLGGELIAGKDILDNIVEEFLVGAMTPESALKYFRRSKQKAVITGGDRADIALAALETSTNLLLLTGNLYPSVQVIEAAKEKNVPVLVVPYDTYTTITKLDELTGKISPEDKNKIKATLDVVEKHIDWKAIINKLE